MASIKKRGDGWSVRWRDPDGKPRRRQAPTRSAAKRLERDIAEAHALGKRWEPEATRVVPTVDEVVDAYLADRLRVWKPNTHAIRAVELAIFTEWADPDESIGVLSRELLSAYWAHLVDERGNSRGTANNRTRLLQLMWQWVWDHDDFGPFVNRPRSIDLPTIASATPIVPTFEQVDKLIAVGRASTAGLDRVRTLIVMRYTGLRSNQARRLLWSDLDMERKLLRIRPELGKTKQEQSGRIVPVSQHLIDEVAGWGVREGRLIGKDATRELHRATPLAWWRKTDVAEELYRRRPTHCIRKAFSTELRRRGADPDAISYLLGHNLGITAGVYTDPSALGLVDAADLVPAIQQCVPSVPEAKNLKLIQGGGSQ